MMDAGYAFSLPDRFGIRHTYVVISDPKNLTDIHFSGYVFFIMLTSLEKHKECCCVLKQGEHPSITHDTVPVYKVPPAGFVPLALLQEWKIQERLIEKEPVATAVLKKLQDGYLQSKYQKDNIFQFLFRQGIIE